MGLLAGVHLLFCPSGDYGGRQDINELPWWYKIARLPSSLNGLQTSKGVVIAMEGSGNNACFAALPGYWPCGCFSLQQKHQVLKEWGWRGGCIKGGGVELSWGKCKCRQSRAWYSVRCWRLVDAKESQSLTVCPLQTALSAYIKGCMSLVCVCVRIENHETDWSQTATLKAGVGDVFSKLPLHCLIYFILLCCSPLKDDKINLRGHRFMW